MHLRPKNQSVQLFLGSVLVWESLRGMPLLSVPSEKKIKIKNLRVQIPVLYKCSVGAEVKISHFPFLHLHFPARKHVNKHKYI